MRMGPALVLPIVLSLPFSAGASDGKSPCASAAHRQFDFWIGEWDVRTPDGKLAGSNRITSILGGCGLQENWTGARGTIGTSLNTYDDARGLWHQTWIDSAGTFLLLEGALQDGRMVLKSAGPPQKGQPLDRITWEPLQGGDVRQLWEQSSDGGATWTVAFDGHYTRKR